LEAIDVGGWLGKVKWPIIIQSLKLLGDDGNGIARGLAKVLESTEDREELERIIIEYWRETSAIRKLMEEFARLYDPARTNELVPR
jgi:hypothetical protein